MTTWSTIIIFEYNDIQIIGTTDNGHVDVSQIGTAVSNFYAAVSSIAPSGSIITYSDTYVLTISNEYTIEFIPNGNTMGNLPCSIGWPSIDPATLASIDAMVTEIQIYI